MAETERLSFAWIKKAVHLCQNMQHGRVMHKKDLQMCSMIVCNGFCHGLKHGQLGRVKAVDVAIGHSKLIEDTALMRSGIKIDEENCKKDVIDKCTHGTDGWGNFPHAAVTKDQKKWNSNTHWLPRCTRLAVKIVTQKTR